MDWSKRKWDVIRKGPSSVSGGDSSMSKRGERVGLKSMSER